MPMPGPSSERPEISSDGATSARRGRHGIDTCPSVHGQQRVAPWPVDPPAPTVTRWAGTAQRDWSILLHRPLPVPSSAEGDLARRFSAAAGLGHSAIVLTFVKSLRKFWCRFGRASVSRDNWSSAVEEGPLSQRCRKNRTRVDRAAQAITIMSPADSQGAGA